MNIGLPFSLRASRRTGQGGDVSTQGGGLVLVLRACWRELYQLRQTEDLARRLFDPVICRDGRVLPSKMIALIG